MQDFTIMGYDDGSFGVVWHGCVSLTEAVDTARGFTRAGWDATALHLFDGSPGALGAERDWLALLAERVA